MPISSATYMNVSENFTPSPQLNSTSWMTSLTKDRINMGNGTSPMPSNNMSAGQITRATGLRIANDLIIYIQPVLFALGLVNNSLILALMSRPRIRNSSTSIYYRATAINDILVTVFLFFMSYLLNLRHFDILNVSTVVCRMMYFMLYSSMVFGSWTIVTIAVEKVIAVYFPFKAKILCTPRKALVTLFVILLLSCMAWVGELFFWFVDDEGRCVPFPQYKHFVSFVRRPLLLTTFQFVPYVIIIICNIIIIQKLIRSDRKRHDLTGESKQVTRLNRQSIITVVAISLTFLLLTSPSTVYFMYLATIENPRSMVLTSPVYAMINSVTSLLFNANYVINFYLYMLTSQQYRTELKKMICLEKGNKKSTLKLRRLAENKSDISVVCNTGPSTTISSAAIGSN